MSEKEKLVKIPEIKEYNRETGLSANNIWSKKKKLKLMSASDRKYLFNYKYWNRNRILTQVYSLS